MPIRLLTLAYCRDIPTTDQGAIVAVLDACRLVDQAIRAQPAYAHTSHFRLEVDGRAVFDRH